MRFGLPLLLIIMLGLTSGAQARDAWQGKLSERMFHAFLTLYQQDPSALARFAGGLTTISSAQLDETMDFLGVTHLTYLYPMILHGYDMPDLKGQANAGLSLMAPRGPNHTMIPIPFQIDEFDKTGLIWIDGYNKAKPEGVPGEWDDFDQLVFMYRDGAPQRYDATQQGQIKGQILKEIRLDAPPGKPRWVYLVKDNPERSDADYVNTNLAQGQVDTTLFSLNYDPKNMIRIHSIIPKAGPKHGVNTFGGFDLSISTGLLSKHLRVSLDKDNIHATPLAVKDGPIRNILLVKSRIWYFGLPTLFDQRFMVDFYEQGITVPSRFALDSMRTLRFFLAFLREPSINFGIHFKNLDGAKVTFENVFEQQQYGHIDGKMSAFEQRMDATRLPGDWLFMDSRQGWQMFFANHIPVVPNGLFEQFLDGVNMHMVYDDKMVKQKDSPAQPELTLGFTSSGLPRTAIRMLASLPKLDFRNMNTLGEAIVALGEAGKDGKLKDYDAIVNARMHDLMKSGFLTSVPQLAELFLKDLDRMHFTGIRQGAFNQLVHDAIIATVKQPDQIDHGAVLREMVTLAQQRHINLLNLRYAFMDNAVWLPDWVGAGGPAAFSEQLDHPPSFTLLPYSPAHE